MSRLLLWWHFHQPLYKINSTGEYKLPWVFLHLIKDYHFFLKLAQRFPNIKQNFNFTPVLLEQIEDYVRDREHSNDDFIRVFLKDSKDLSKEEREFLLKNFFSIYFEKTIQINERYRDLFYKKDNSETWNDQDYTDLQFLFFYYWTCPIVRGEDDGLKEIIRKKSFTIQDKSYLWAKIDMILNGFFDLFKQAANSDNIEITFSPYYHPILPLINDTDCVKNTGIKLPGTRFSFPKDAEDQIMLAKGYMKRFDIHPAGMWPSEGSLDDRVFDLFEKHSIKYVGSDEKILRAIDPENMSMDLFRFKNTTVFFRDRTLSDRIAFKYQYLNIDDAVNDLIHYIDNDRLNIIIMDGENAWEYFDDNGLPFLNALYSSLGMGNIQTYTLKEADNAFEKGELRHFIPGSWIDVGFPLWIGSAGKNKSWEILAALRNLIDDKMLENDAIKKKLYAVEGSDWNWWYDTFYNGGSESFDHLYTQHLKDLVETANIPFPLDQISIASENVYYRLPVRFINPFINGKENNFFEWLYAGFLDIKNISGTMKQTDSIAKKLIFGFDIDHLFLRLDFFRKGFNRVNIRFIKNENIDISIHLDDNTAKLNGNFTDIEFACDEIFEIKIPFKLIDTSKNEDIQFKITLYKDDDILEVHPTFSYIHLKSPSEDFHMRNWRV